MSGLEEKPFAGTGKRRKNEIWVFGLEEKGFGFGREDVCKYRKKKEEGRKKKKKIF